MMLETPAGRKPQGQAKVSEGIHPEGVGIAAVCGHWAQGMPIARSKGVVYNELLEVDLEHLDPVRGAAHYCGGDRLGPSAEGPSRSVRWVRPVITIVCHAPGQRRS